eukprot:jgi/Psemu1/43190/gm1.43190_g
MLTYTRFVILAATLVAALAPTGSASAFRGREGDGDGEEANTHRRHLVEDDADCVLYKKIVEHPEGSIVSWSCDFQFQPNLARTLGGVHMMDIYGLSNDVIESYGVVSGEAVMKVKGSYVEQSISTNASKLVVPEEASFTIENILEDDRRHHKQRRRQLDAEVGTKKTLVVRVTDNAGVAIAGDQAQLVNDVFTDAACLKTQYAACSYNQLIFEQSAEGGGTGVIDMTIDIAATSDKTALEQASKTALETRYNGDAASK